MLTTRGRLLSASSIALVVTGRLVGVRELFQLGLGLATLVGAACVAVRRRRQIVPTRTVQPVEAFPGATIDVELSISAGPRRSSSLLFVDRLAPGLAGSPAGWAPVSRGAAWGSALSPAGEEAPLLPAGTESVSFPIGPIHAGTVRRFHYRLAAARRGSYEIGPGSTVATDPFGLAHAPLRSLAASTVLVLPPVEELAPLAAASRAAAQGIPLPQAPIGPGEDFSALRLYQPGDDPKKIHWRTTARQGRLMVRQEDRFSEVRTLVLLQDGRETQPPGPAGEESFEACVASAASLVHLFAAQGLAVALASCSQAGAGPAEYGQGAEHERMLLRRLAVAAPAKSLPGRQLVTGLHALLDPRLGESYLALVTGETDLSWVLEATLRASGRTDRGLPLLVVRHLPGTASGPSRTAPGPAGPPGSNGSNTSYGLPAVTSALAVERAGGTVLEVAPGESLAACWERQPGLSPAFSADSGGPRLAGRASRASR